MSNYEEIGKMVSNLLKKSEEEDLTLWIVEEETGESIKLYDYLNSEKHANCAKFIKER